MRHRSFAALRPGLVLPLVLAGCGGTPNAVTGPPSVQSGGLAAVHLTVQWPSRGIPAAATKVAVVVSAADIGTPIQGEIIRPATDLTLWVPPGTGRSFQASAYDANGNCLAVGGKSGVAITAGTANEISVALTTSTSSTAVTVGWAEGADATPPVSLTLDWTGEPLPSVPVELNVDWTE